MRRSALAALLLLIIPVADACDSHFAIELSTALAEQTDTAVMHEHFDWRGTSAPRTYAWNDKVFVPGPLVDVAVKLRYRRWYIGLRHVSAVMDGVRGSGLDLIEVGARWTLWGDAR